MRKMHVTLITFLVCCTLSSAFAMIDRDAALEMVTTDLLGGNLDCVRIYAANEPVGYGSGIFSWKHRIYTAPSDGWFIFIDDFAQANWEHPCRYVHVDLRDGGLSVKQAMTPPLDIETFYEMPTKMKRIAESASEHFPVQYIGPLKNNGGMDDGHSYAVLISGGASQWSNHIRYYNDTAFIFATLKEVYGYSDDDIFVLVSDGTDPAPDRSNGTNSPPDMDGDGTDDIEYPAVMWAINDVFDILDGIVTANDQVFFFFTDHGGSNGGWNVYLNLWNWETMSDATFASLVNSLPGAQYVFTMEQCYSGGFEDNLTNLPPRVFSSACAYNQYSWAMANLIYDEYVYYWISAVRGEDPYGGPVDADYNDDGRVTMDEAFIYAEAHDTRDETPQYDENPAGLGADVTLDYGEPGPRLSLEVSNYPYMVQLGSALSWDIAVANLNDFSNDVDLWVEITSDWMGQPYYRYIDSFTLAPGEERAFHVGRKVPVWVPIDFYDVKSCVGLYNTDVYASDTFTVILFGG